MAGYSGTPLIKKLGIKENCRIALVNPPTNFNLELGLLPEGAILLSEAQKPLDLIIFFAKDKAILKKGFVKLATKLAQNGLMWTAWPKKGSGVPTDLSFEAVQKVGLEAGLVDTKVCAINDIWSGLRFVIRLKDRVTP